MLPRILEWWIFVSIFDGRRGGVEIYRRLAAVCTGISRVLFPIFLFLGVVCVKCFDSSVSGVFSSVLRVL